jgi:hypothetical protein
MSCIAYASVGSLVLSPGQDVQKTLVAALPYCQILPLISKP